jgi:hypothetical protein
MLQLARAHAVLDEVGELSAQARLSSDPTIEATVVHKRYELGRELLSTWGSEGHGPAAHAKADVDDPFPLVVGPPEIDLSELDVDILRGAIAHHGCLIVKRFFPTATMQQLRDGIDRMATGFDRWMASKQSEVTPSWFVPFEAVDAVLPLALRNMCGPLGTFYAGDAPHLFLDLIDAFDAAGLPQLLVDYMREPVLLALEKTSVRRVPSTVPNAWHQDGNRFSAGMGVVNVWVALCHCGIDAPTIAVLPQRVHEILPLDGDSLVPWEIRADALANAANGVEPVELVLEPGDAVLFDEMLPHTTLTRDDMTKPRYCADAWFWPSSAFPTELYKPLAYAVP